MKNGFFIITLFGLVTFSAVADDCQEVNFYQEQGNSIHEMPIYNQQGLNTCYAYAAAQMWEHDNRNHGIKEKTSPLWIALVSKLERKVHYQPGRLDFNYILWSIKDLKNWGLCSQDYITQKINAFKGKNPMNEVELAYVLQKIWMKYERYNLLDPFGKRVNHFDFAYDIVAKDKKIKKYLPYSLKEKLRTMAKYGYLQFPKFFMNEVINGCKKKFTQSLPQYKHTAFLGRPNQSTANLINESLTKSNATPISIGYCAGVWRKDKGVKLLARSPFINQIFRQRSCGAHYSVIVGQKKIAGKCQYLIRNSWGDKWSSYNRKCHIQLKDGSVIDTYPHSTAKLEGTKILGCWLSREDLFSNMFDLTWLN